MLFRSVPAIRTDASAELVRRGAAVRGELVAFASRKDLPTAQQTWALWTLGRIALDDPTLDTWFAETAAKL